MANGRHFFQYFKYLKKNGGRYRDNSGCKQDTDMMFSSQQRTPKNISIRLISPVDYIFAADSTSPCILKQSCLKSRASTLNDSTRKTVFYAK